MQLNEEHIISSNVKRTSAARQPDMGVRFQRDLHERERHTWPSRVASLTEMKYRTREEIMLLQYVPWPPQYRTRSIIRVTLDEFKISPSHVLESETKGRRRIHIFSAPRRDHIDIKWKAIGNHSFTCTVDWIGWNLQLKVSAND